MLQCGAEERFECGLSKSWHRCASSVSGVATSSANILGASSRLHVQSSIIISDNHLHKNSQLTLMLRRFLAARVIQASWRGFWGRKQFQLQYSARKIQSLWRGYVARRAFRAHYAAGTIQKCWRGFAIRKQGLLLQEIQKRTAVKIQAHYRGYLTRRSLKRATQEEAVIRIQRGWRRVRERRRAKALKQRLREQEAAQHSAATTIQAHQRSKMARSYAASERRKVREARENLAAREIQRVARGKHARERLRREREAAIAVQRELATITIQRVHRGRQGRKIYHSKRQEQAATKCAKLAPQTYFAQLLHHLTRIARGFSGFKQHLAVRLRGPQ